MAKVVLSALGIELRGRAGSSVFASTKYGIVLRSYTVPKNPRTPAQTASRARFSGASALWKTLTPEERAAWKDYARTLPPVFKRDGTPKHPTPQTVFVGLGSKFLQVHPGGEPPRTPPASPFFGDGITVTATGGTGGILFTASGPNADHVVTELLVQPLAHEARAPKANLYRTQTFVVFAPGALSHTVDAAPGCYAPAVRFVRADTGQEAQRLPLPAVLVA